MRLPYTRPAEELEVVSLWWLEVVEVEEEEGDVVVEEGKRQGMV